MSLFIPPKRKLLELLVLPMLLTVFYFIDPQVEALSLFSFGFVWNWAASNDLEILFDNNKRYRMSLLKMVFNFQRWILKPFGWAPELVKRLICILPAGIFWGLVIFINDSIMPWWATFIGSLAFELTQMSFNFLRKPKEEAP